MEKEINIIKKQYQSTAVPEMLLISGVDDLWRRVDTKSSFFNVHFQKAVLTGGILLLIFSGFVGISFAYPKQGTIFYEVKKITQKALDNLSKTPLLKIHNVQIQQNVIPNKDSQITPSIQPSPTEKIDPTYENRKPESINQINDHSSSSQNKNPHEEDVKGVSTSEDNNNSNNNRTSSENLHGKNDNSNNSQSQNNSSSSNGSGQNSDKGNENHGKK